MLKLEHKRARKANGEARFNLKVLGTRLSQINSFPHDRFALRRSHAGYLFVCRPDLNTCSEGGTSEENSGKERVQDKTIF